MNNQPESTLLEDNITSILSVINNLPVSEFLEDKDVKIHIPVEDSNLLPPQFKEIADKLHKQYLYWQILRNRQATTKPTFFGYIHQAINDSAKSVEDSSDKNVDSQTVQLIETAITLATINALLIGAEEYLTEGNHQQDVKESIDTALSTLYEFIKVREIMSSSLRDALEEIRQEIEGMSEAQQLASYVVTQLQRLRENPQIKDSAKFYVVKNQLEKLGKTLELLIPADEINPQEATTADKSQIEGIIAKLLLRIAKEEFYMTTIHHHGGVESATFSPDGNYLATASEDKTAKVVEVATGKEITTIHHQNSVNSVTFSPDGNYLATASYDYTAKVVEVATGKEIITIHHQRRVKSATFSPDSNYLATASDDKTAKVIEVATGKEITTIHHQYWVNSAQFSPDGNYLATASGDNTAKVIEVATGKEITTIHHQYWVNSAQFSPDGNYLATASGDNTAKVVEVATGKEITTIHHQYWVNSATFSPDGNYLATASGDNTAKVVEVATGKEITTIHHQDSVYLATFSPDGNYLATASGDSTAKVVEVAIGKEIITIRHQGWVNSAKFSPDGNYLATVSKDKTVKLVNLAKLRQLLENNQNDIPSNPSQVNALIYIDKPQAFFLHWLQNQANDYSFYEYILKQAQQENQGFSVHNQIPLLDTDLCLQSLNFLLLNAEKHYQSVFPLLKGIEDKSIRVIALYDMKQSIMAGLATLHEFINNLMKFEGKDYQKAIQIFREEIEKEVKTTEIATDIYRRSQSLSQLEGIENFGELATIKDMLGEMVDIFKQVLPLSITSPPPKTPVIPLQVNQRKLRRELIESINQAQPSEVKELIKHFISLGFKIDRKTAIAAINKYNRFIFVSPWDDVTDYKVLLRLLGS